MKNTLVLASLVLALGYPCVVAAEVIGVAFPTAFSGEVFIGVITAVGMLALVFGDYSRKSNYKPGSTRDNALQTEIAMRPSPAPAPTAWIYQTIAS